MKIEPIHEIPVEDLPNLFDAARESNKLLKTIADSIKESLALFFPELRELIAEIVDANEAIYAKSWAKGFYPLLDGVEALRKTYGAIESPKTFDGMIEAVKEYVLKASDYSYSFKLKQLQPLIELGKEKQRQLHQPRQKKNKALLLYCINLMKIKPSPSAQHLFDRIPKKENVATINGWLICKAWSDEGEQDKIFCISPEGKTKTIGFKAFQKYYVEVKKLLR